MPAFDWDAVADEAVGLLQRYIRIDTTNPPGNEELACDFLAALLAAEGIPSRKLVSAPGRANLVADLPGADDRSRSSCSTTPTSCRSRRAHWTVDPFAGVIKDGFLWGRGTIDMKGMGILELLTLLALKRRGVACAGRCASWPSPTKRPAATTASSGWTVHHPELIERVAFVINEGGYGADSYLGVERPLFGVSMAEKSPLWLTLKATGRPGHGSAPHDDNVLDRMVRAMQHDPGLGAQAADDGAGRRVAAGRARRGLHRARPGQDVAGGADRPLPAADLAADEHDQRHRPALRHQAQRHPRRPPRRRSTAASCPATTRERFIAELRSVIDDPKVEIETVFAAESPITPSGTELHAAIRDVCKSVMPGAAVLPRVMAGFTDSRTFRRHGVPAYGFVPMLLGPDEQGGMHGNDERISLKNLRLGVEVLYQRRRARLRFFLSFWV